MRRRSSPFRGRFLTRGEFQSEICRDAGGSDVVKLYISVLFNVFRKTASCKCRPISNTKVKFSTEHHVVYGFAQIETRA